MPNAKILSVATATPPHKVPQIVAKDFARETYGASYRDNPRLFERLLRMFDNAGIDDRYFCVPPGWFYEDHSWGEKNALYAEHAMDLSAKAARRALDKVGARPEDVGRILVASTTGITTPTIDSQLIEVLGLPLNAQRTPLWGLGCAAGAAGIARAAEQAQHVPPGQLVLFVGVELCGLTVQHSDSSTKGILSSALFGDGAAAVVLGTEAEGPEVIGGYSTTWPATLDYMGWDVGDNGFDVVLSDKIPAIVRRDVPESLDAACASVGLSVEDLDHLVLHPGGSRVLDAWEDVLGLGRGGAVLSREVLRDFGNMSSVTVLFMLERLLESGDWREGEHGVVSALGPGFAAEHAFFTC